jgi:hypothetical protein
MKFRLCLFALGLLLVSAATVRADVIPPDPDIIVGGDTGSGPVNSLPFSFTIPADTQACTVNNLSGQCFRGFNNTGVTIPSLVINFPSAVSNVTCGQGALAVFANCVVTALNQVTFSGGTGIANQTHFFIFLQDGFPTGAYTAAIVPEPATLGLLATGLGAIFAGRKLRKRAAGRT